MRLPNADQFEGVIIPVLTKRTARAMNGREIRLMALWFGLGIAGLGLSFVTVSRCIILNDSQLECTRPYLLPGVLVLIAGVALIYYAISILRRVTRRRK